MLLWNFHNSYEKEITISYSYKPIPEQGSEHFKQEQSMNFLKNKKTNIF